MVLLLLQVQSQSANVGASLLPRLAGRNAGVVLQYLRKDSFLMTGLLHQAGMLACRSDDLCLYGLAWCGGLVEPPVQIL